ncbi:MAG: hypothetical protein V3V01_16730 [Acidimicrobiales bacterium]
MAVSLSCFAGRLALLGSFPLLLAAATSLSTVAMIRAAGLEKFAASPIGTADDPFRIEVGILSEVVW